MARHFLRLKLALLRNRLRANGTSGVLGVVLGVAVALPCVGLGIALLSISRVQPEIGDPLTVALFVTLLLGWILLPIFAFGTDDTLDPARLSLFPLTHRQLMTGLLASSFVGIPALATLVTLVGGALVYARSLATLPVALVIVLVQFLLCVTASRATTTLLAGALRSRRGRDAVILVGSMLGVVAYGASNAAAAASRTGGFDGQGLSTGLARVAAITPAGQAAHALIATRDGVVATAFVHLLLAAGWIVVFVAVWALALRRTLVTPETGGRPSTAAAGSLFRGPLRWLPASRLGAVAAREIRYLVRDPRRRVQWISPVVIGLFGPLRVGGGGGSAAAIVAAAAFAAFLGGSTAVNQFGFDGGAYWMHVSAPGRARDDFAGRNIATLVVAVAVGTVAAAVAALLSRRFEVIPLAVLAAAAVGACATGVGNVMSAWFPQPVPATSSNPWGTGGTGTGCITGLVQLAAIVLQAVVVIPVVVLCLLANDRLGPGALVVTVPIATAYAIGVWWLGSALAARRVDGREPEVLAAVSVERGV